MPVKYTKHIHTVIRCGTGHSQVRAAGQWNKNVFFYHRSG